MSWDYSDLSHQAKAAGGPEKLLETIEKFNYQEGVKDGKNSQNPVIALVGLFCLGIGVGGVKLYQFVRGEIKKSQQLKIMEVEASEARECLVKGMKEANVAESQDATANDTSLQAEEEGKDE